MNYKAFLMLPILFLLPGCGARKVCLLNKLYPKMTKGEVKSTIGEPDLIQCPMIDKKGNVIDIWEYRLATVDEAKESKGNALRIGGLCLCWPLLLFPSAWESPYNYDTYFLRFINNLLEKWGNRCKEALDGQINKSQVIIMNKIG